MRVPKVAAINDLSGLGRCSLTAAIPILSAMGVQACPLPTAALSNQTGFESFASVDLSEQIPRFSCEWRKRGVTFDGIYTGFLNGPAQAGQIADWINQFRTPQTHVLVDPVLGDRGHIYPVFDRTMIAAVRALVTKADIITPNLTEACILAGTSYEEAMRSDRLDTIRLAACALQKQGPSTVVITGIPRGEQIVNAVFSPQGVHLIATQRLGDGFSGTGDILASVLCGGLIRGLEPKTALDLAAALLQKAIVHTFAEGADPNDGVAFEPYLYLLTDREAYR